MENHLLSVENISIDFTQYTKGLKQKDIKTIVDLNLDIDKGEIVAVLGSSGSGKSLLAHAILGILPVNAILSGQIKYKNQLLDQETKEKIRGYEISLIPQSVNFLDPLMKIKYQVIGAYDKEDKELEANLIKKQKEIFKRYNLDEKVEDFYPHELSGGMARRVLVATTMMRDPDLVIADEPTPGLDEKSVIETLRYLKEIADNGTGVMLITHDIEAALRVADKIAVFYAGSVIETANVEDFSGEGEKLRHPYTKALWNSLPENKFIAIEGSQPLADEIKEGCSFYDRCPIRKEKCKIDTSEYRELNDGYVRCFYAD